MNKKIRLDSCKLVRCKSNPEEAFKSNPFWIVENTSLISGTTWITPKDLYHAKASNWTLDEAIANDLMMNFINSIGRPSAFKSLGLGVQKFTNLVRSDEDTMFFSGLFFLLFFF